jgi:ankyrin repeat protein
LGHAVWLRKLDVVRILVKELGADVHQGNSQGATPLCIAAQEGFVHVVRCKRQPRHGR